MKKIMVGLIFTMIIFLTGNAYSSTLGRRYVGGFVGQGKFGDDALDDLLGTMTIFGVEMRSPINENLDFTASFSRGSADTGTVYNPYYDVFAKLEVTSMVFGGGINYQFAPGEQVNPYILAGINWAKAEAKLTLNGYSEKEDDDEIGFNFGGGVELGIGDAYTGPEMSVLAGLGYSTIGDGDFILGVSFNVWATQQMLISLGIDYGFDEGNRTIYGGFAIGF